MFLTDYHAPDYHALLERLQWQADSALLPERVRNWLSYPDSLTQKLQQHCQDLRVQVLAEQWLSEQIWRREVCLHADGVAWVYGQTDVPRETILQVAPDFLHLGNKPIGLWLFPQNPIRQNLEWAFDPESGCYARRSTLLLRDYPLYISELFLPGFPFFAKSEESRNKR